MTIFLQVFYVIFSAFIESFAIPNEFLLFGSPFLGLFALVPLYIALFRAKSFKEAGLLLSLQFTLTHLLSSFWLAYFKDFAALTLGGTVGYYTVLGYFLGQLFFIPIHFTKKLSLHERTSFSHMLSIVPWNIPARIVLFACLWTIYEWHKSLGFLAYPWVTILMSSWKWPLVTQIVSITGTWGITFLFSLFNAVIAEGILNGFFVLERHFTKPNKAPQVKLIQISPYAWSALFCIALFACSVIQGIFQYTKERVPIKHLNTIIVQTNTDSWLTFNDEEAIKIGQELTLDAIENYDSKPDIVVWSEALLSRPYPHAIEYYEQYPPQKPLAEFIGEVDAPFIIGGPSEINIESAASRGFRQYNNAAQFYHSDGTWKDFYGKIHLVPFAEIIPYANSVFVQNFMKAIVGFSSGWSQGEFYKVFEVPTQDGNTVKISTPICFEDAFPHICRALFFEGSEAFYNITNDSWSKTNSAEIQHFVIASFRAQEFRTPLLRSTNSGFSVVVDPAGKIIYSLPLFEAVSGGIDVPIFEREITLYALLGDWLPKLLVALMIILYGALHVTNKTKTTQKKEHTESSALMLTVD